MSLLFQVGELQGELAGVRKEVAVATRELVEQQAAAEAQLGELQVGMQGLICCSRLVPIFTIPPPLIDVSHLSPITTVVHWR